MADDTLTTLDGIQSKCRGYLGKELSPSEMATEFAKWDPIARVETLSQLDAEKGELSAEEASRQIGHLRALRRMHETLRKVDR